jgi:hypothetical protein
MVGLAWERPGTLPEPYIWCNTGTVLRPTILVALIEGSPRGKNNVWEAVFEGVDGLTGRGRTRDQAAERLIKAWKSASLGLEYGEGASPEQSILTVGAPTAE